MANLLLRMGHGLGDVVQFTVVLKHLRRHRPDWNVDVQAGIGKHTALKGLCRRVYHDREPAPIGPYDSDVSLPWSENYARYTDRPNTKITNCLRDVFGIDWDYDLARYEVHVVLEHWPRVQKYLDGLGIERTPGGSKHRAVVMHYQGNTSQGKKNLHHYQAARIVEAVARLGRKVILLDWDHRSPLPDDKNVFCPRVGPGDLWGDFGSGDVAIMAALIGQCEAFIGIDSGPGKVASATDQPALICWRGHHPIQFHDPAPNTEHLIPCKWWDMPPINGSNEIAEFFRRHYEYGTYDGDEALPDKVAAWLALKLEGRPMGEPPHPQLVERHGFWVHAGEELEQQDYVVIKDLIEDDAYKTALIGNRGPGEIVLDVGAHIGVFSVLWHRKNPGARIFAVECCPENLMVLKANLAQQVPQAHLLEAAVVGDDKQELVLLNALGPWGKSTGGSRVVDRAFMEANRESQYWHDTRPLRLYTLEGLMTYWGLNSIDLLKLDCEGSEIGILETAPLDRIRFIVMETHDRAKWRDLLARRFEGWDVGHMSANGECENWHLHNPTWPW